MAWESLNDALGFVLVIDAGVAELWTVDSVTPEALRPLVSAHKYAFTGFAGSLSGECLDLLVEFLQLFLGLVLAVFRVLVRVIYALARVDDVLTRSFFDISLRRCVFSVVRRRGRPVLAHEWHQRSLDRWRSSWFLGRGGCLSGISFFLFRIRRLYALARGFFLLDIVGLHILRRRGVVFRHEASTFLGW